MLEKQSAKTPDGDKSDKKQTALPDVGPENSPALPPITSNPTPKTVLNLQKLIGNRATVNLLSTGKTSKHRVQRVAGVFTGEREHEEQETDDQANEQNQPLSTSGETPPETPPPPPPTPTQPVSGGTSPNDSSPNTNGNMTPGTNGTGTPTTQPVSGGTSPNTENANTGGTGTPDPNTPSTDAPVTNMEVEHQPVKTDTPSPSDIVPGGENPIAQSIQQGGPGGQLQTLQVESQKPPKPTTGSSDKGTENAQQSLNTGMTALQEQPTENPDVETAKETTESESQGATGNVQANQSNTGAMQSMVTQVGTAPVDFAQPTPDNVGHPLSQEELQQLETQRGQSQGLVSGFMGDASGQAQTILDAAAGVPGRLQAGAEAARQALEAGIAEKKAELSARNKQLRAQLSGQAAAAKRNIESQHQAAVTAIQAATTTARENVETEHQTAITALEKKQTDEIQQINNLYGQALRDQKQTGVIAGTEAMHRGEERAQVFLRGKINRRDSLTDGYLTDRKAEARAKAARAVAKEYYDGLIKAADEQAQKGQVGKSRDLETVRTVVSQTRQALRTQRQTALQNLGQQERDGIKQADDAKRSLTQAVNQSLSAALQTLRHQEQAQLKTLSDGGQVHLASLENASNQAISSLQEYASQGVSALTEQLNSLNSSFNGTLAPDPEQLGSGLTDGKAQITGTISEFHSQYEQAVSQSEQGLTTAGQQSLDSLGKMVEAGIAEFTTTADSAKTSLGGLNASVSRTFGKLQEATTKGITGLSKTITEGFNKISEGVDTTFQKLSLNLVEAFNLATPGLQKALREAVHGDMERDINTKAAEAAAAEKPAWQSLVKWVLIIAVIIVVAVFVGPAVIGAVGAFAGALGASTAAAGVIGAVVGGAIVGAASSGVIQVINNGFDGRNLLEGVGTAMLVGAIGGAIGGAGGLVGQAFARGASSVAGQFVRQFAVDAAFNVVGSVVGAGVQSLISGQPINWGDTFTGFLQGMAISVAVGGLARTGRVASMQNRSFQFGARGGFQLGGGIAGGLGRPVNTGFELTTPSGQKISGEDLATQTGMNRGSGGGNQGGGNQQNNENNNSGNNNQQNNEDTGGGSGNNQSQNEESTGGSGNNQSQNEESTGGTGNNQSQNEESNNQSTQPKPNEESTNQSNQPQNEESNAPTNQSQQNEESTNQSTQPQNEESNAPTNQSQQNEESTNQSNQSQQNEESTNQSTQPKPNEEPVNQTNQSTQPTEETNAPTNQSTQPTEESTTPTNQSQPTEESAPPSNQPQPTEDTTPRTQQQQDLENAGIPRSEVDKLTPEQAQSVQDALNNWNPDANGKNQGVSHVVEYAQGAAGDSKAGRLKSLAEQTGTGPYSVNDPEVIPKVTQALNDIRANKGGVTLNHAGNKDGKVIYFYPKDGVAVPASGTYSNSQKGIIIIEYQGKMSSFMSSTYKGYTKMD